MTNDDNPGEFRVSVDDDIDMVHLELSEIDEDGVKITHAYFPPDSADNLGDALKEFAQWIRDNR